MRNTFLLCSLLWIYSINVVAQITETDIQRLSVIIEKTQGLTSQLSSGDIVQQERALKTLDALIDELIRIVKEDPEIHKMYEELIRELENLELASTTQLANNKSVTPANRDNYISQSYSQPDSKQYSNQNGQTAGKSRFITIALSLNFLTYMKCSIHSNIDVDS